MKVYVIASSSEGNCLLLSDGGTNILFDAGISMRRILHALAQLGLTMQEIGGVFISHEHSDHICGLKSLAKYHNFPVYAPSRVSFRLRSILPDLEDRLRIIPVGASFHLGCIEITAFHTRHDTEESVGYRICGSGSFAIATDTGCVTEEIVEGLLGAQAVLIESNHDERLLCDGPYPYALKRRILSDRGHLSNADCAALARLLSENGTEILVLGHLSSTNNTPQLALSETGKAIAGSKSVLLCAPKLGILEIDVGKGKYACRQTDLRWKNA